MLRDGSRCGALLPDACREVAGGIIFSVERMSGATLREQGWKTDHCRGGAPLRALLFDGGGGGGGGGDARSADEDGVGALVERLSTHARGVVKIPLGFGKQWLRRTGFGLGVG